MTEPVSQSAAERLAALRATSKDRGKPAHVGKILTAGLSTSAMFGLVAAMGWGSTVQGSALPPDTAVQVVPVAPVVTNATTTSTTTTPTTTVVAPIAAPMSDDAPVPTPPAITAPVTAAPVATDPVTIPVAVPAPAPPAQKKKIKATSNVATKSSG
jgi:hypothetical protein